MKRWVPQRIDPGMAATALLLLVYTIVLFRTAWLSDDAYITFRTIDNALHGYGLRWNIAERVQTFTHPLWILLLVPLTALFRDPYYAAYFLSISCSVAAVSLLIFVFLQSSRARILALLALVLSRAFIDYSTSGLENPLTHLLLVIFLVQLRRVSSPRSLMSLSIVAGLLLLNRLDVALLVAPSLVICLRDVGWRHLGRVVIGMTPLILWEGFSLIYYGTLVPNTAYAKLGLDVKLSTLLAEGLHYLYSSFLIDPITLSLVLIGILVGLIAPRERHCRTLGTWGGMLPRIHCLHRWRLHGGSFPGCSSFDRSSRNSRHPMGRSWFRLDRRIGHSLGHNSRSNARSEWPGGLPRILG